MPILIKDYDWNQSDSKVSIRLPLKGAKASNVSIILSQEYAKVSYAPFYFECWLYAKIDDDRSLMSINQGIVSLELHKLNESEKWPQLNHVDDHDKDLLRQVREAALDYTRDKENRKSKEKVELIAANKKIALQEQMKLEQEEKARIQSVKEREKNEATREIEAFKDLHRQTITKEVSSVLKDDKKPIFDAEQVEISKQEKVKTQAEPRVSSKIQIKFTPRVFPTPSRESTDNVEREWLQNQLEARKLAELPGISDDLSKEEMNLDWLKEKGSKLYKDGNYLGAIGVYNHGIRLFPKNPALYSNRAACHYQVRNLIKCVEDCSRALELLTPPVEQNSQSRLKAHVRRGTAFCELEMYVEGLMDYEAALKIDPHNDDIKRDSHKIRNIIQATDE